MPTGFLQLTYNASLVAIPQVKISFEQVEVDLVVPQEPKSRGSRFILILGNYAIHYPKAMVICMASAQMELLWIFSQVSIPKEVLMD